MYKSILVHVDPDDPATANRVAIAAELAHHCAATLVGADASLAPSTVALLSTGGAAISAGAVPVANGDELGERFLAARTLFEHCAGDSVATAWRTAVGFPTTVIASIGARADLLVLGYPRPSSPATSYFDYGDLIMRAGRPVLVIPHETPHLALENVVVAWRNTRESRRAIGDALPLLEMAGTVHVVHVRERTDNGEEASLPDVCAFLEAHAVKAVPSVLDRGTDTSARCIIKFATEHGAGLLVAGAFGHWRIREWAFGGVTRDFLAVCSIPCLLSH